MAENLPTLTGVQRAAVLLLAMGSDNAAQVLKHLNPKEVQVLGAAMASLENINRSVLYSCIIIRFRSKKIKGADC